MIQKDFGIRAVKQMIDKKSVSAIDVKSFEPLNKIKSIQASHPSEITDYLLDNEKDVLKYLHGYTKESETEDILSNRNIGGADGINLNARVNLDNIVNIVTQLYKYSFSKKTPTIKYESSYTRVTDETVITAIKTNIIDQFKSMNNDLYLSVPSKVDLDSIKEYRYSCCKESTEALDISKVVNSISNEACLDSISISIIPHEQTLPIVTYPLFNYLNTKVCVDGITYVIYSGDLYKVNTDFLKKVEEGINSVELFEVLGPESYSDESAFNENAAKNRKDYLCLDRSFLTLEQYKNLEICDLLTLNKELICVKRDKSSTEIGHLCNQVINAAKCLQDDERKMMNDVIRKTAEKRNVDALPFLVNEECRLMQDNYTFVLLILRDRWKSDYKGKNEHGKLRILEGIPFFAQVTIYNCIRTIKSMGYGVKLGYAESHKDSTKNINL